MKIPIYNDLTPENAAEAGYQWVQDVIYDRQAPEEVMEDIVELVQKQNYRLGQTASSIGKDIGQGLYAPIKGNRVKIFSSSGSKSPQVIHLSPSSNRKKK